MASGILSTREGGAVFRYGVGRLKPTLRSGNPILFPLILREKGEMGEMASDRRGVVTRRLPIMPGRKVILTTEGTGAMPPC